MNRKAIRQFLIERTTSDEFVGFCFDYYPDIHAQFMAGMNKDQQIMQLLRAIEAKGQTEQLIHQLEQAFPSRADALQSNPSNQSPASSSRLYGRYGLIGMGLLLLLPFILWVASQVNTLFSAPNTTFTYKVRVISNKNTPVDNASVTLLFDENIPNSTIQTATDGTAFFTLSNQLDGLTIRILVQKDNCTREQYETLRSQSSATIQLRDCQLSLIESTSVPLPTTTHHPDIPTLTPAPTLPTATLAPYAYQLEPLFTPTEEMRQGYVIVFVPEGEIIIDADSFFVPEFWIGKFEVTNQQLAEFITFNGVTCRGGNPCIDRNSSHLKIEQRDGEWQAKAGYENHPAVEVTWFGAVDLCAEINGRLPTSLEWIKAASWHPGTQQTFDYPWGNHTPTTNLANFGNAYQKTLPIGSFPDGRSIVGAYDMNGNVWEFMTNELSNSTNRLWRGGSWMSSDNNINVLAVRQGSGATHEPDIGFRCAFDTDN